MQKIDPRYLLIKVTEVLDSLKIPYLVTGGMAIFVWGRPRFTADIDIVIELKYEDIDNLEKGLRALGEAGYIEARDMKSALFSGGEFNFIDSNTGVKVDFFVSKNSEFERGKMFRRKPKKILGKTVYFISPEDLILSKLHWYTIGESTRQLEDIESVLKISGDKLDMAYIKKWAKKLRVLDIFNSIVKKK
ncbi:MAG: nucleotidyltransferase [Candidatus Spechtbacteria bacterium]|nr:nucleotidyltransferase [Candidatus Spechtbacteria bacterium]